MPDSIPPAVKQILDLFARELAEVKFGGLDRRMLDEAAGRVAAHAEVVARAEAALEAARAQLAESHDALAGRAQRALSYARIFAEDDAELSARLEAISLPRSAAPTTRRIAVDSTPGESAPARRRGRPRAAAAAAAPALFEKRDVESQPAFAPPAS